MELTSDWIQKELNQPWQMTKDGQLVYAVVESLPLPANAVNFNVAMTAIKIKAAKLGLKHILIYISKTAQDDIIQQLYTSGIVNADEYNIDTRPGGDIRVLVFVPAEPLQKVAVAPALYPEHFVQQHAVVHRVVLQTDKAPQIIRKACNRLSLCLADINKFKGEILNLDLSREIDRLRDTVPALKRFLACNQLPPVLMGVGGVAFSLEDKSNMLSWRSTEPDEIELGLDAKYGIVYAAFRRNFYPNAVILQTGMEKLRSEESMSPRTLAYLTYLYEINSAPVTMPWIDFLVKFTYPTPTILAEASEPAHTTNMQAVDNAPGLASLAKQAESDKAEPYKSGDVKKAEDSRLYDKKLKSKVRKELKNKSDFVGSAIVGDLNRTINKISDLPSLYAEVLNKVSIQSLAQICLSCLLKNIPKVDLDALDSEYGLGGVAGLVDTTPDGVPAVLLAPLAFQLPEVPVRDDLASLSRAIEVSLVETLSLALIELVKGVMQSALLECSKSKENYGTTNLNDMLAAPAPEDSALVTQQSKLMELQETLSATLGVCPSDNMKAFLDDVSSILTPNEVCNLVEGNASSESIRLIQGVTAAKYPALHDSLRTTAVAVDFFRIVGRFVPKGLCQNLRASLPEIAGNRLLCDDGSIDEVRKKLLTNKGIPPEIIDVELKNMRLRQLRKIKELVQLAAKPQETVQRMVDEMLCPEGSAGLLPGVPDSLRTSLDLAVDTAFQGVYTAFNREVEEFKDTAKQVLYNEQLLPMTFTVSAGGKKIAIENPEVTRIRATGEAIPVHPDVAKKTMLDALADNNNEQWNQLQTDYMGIKYYKFDRESARVAPMLYEKLQSFEEDAVFKRQEGTSGGYFELLAPALSLNGASNMAVVLKNQEEKKKQNQDNKELDVMSKGLSTLAEDALSKLKGTKDVFSKIQFYYPPVAGSFVLDNEYQVVIYEAPDIVSQMVAPKEVPVAASLYTAQELASDLKNYILTGKNWLGGLAVNGIEEASFITYSPQEIVWSRYVANLWETAFAKVGIPASKVEDQIMAMKSYYIHQTFADMSQDVLGTIAKQIANSFLFRTVVLEQNDALGAVSDKLQSVATINANEINLLDLIRFVQPADPDCPKPKSLLDLDSIKQGVKDQQTKETCLKSSASRDSREHANSLEQAISIGAVYTLLRLYAIEYYLQSIFVFSEFSMEQMLEPFVVDYFVHELNEDMKHRFDKEFCKRFYKVTAREYYKILRSGKLKEIPEDLLKEIKALYEQNSAGLAASYESEISTGTELGTFQLKEDESPICKTASQEPISRIVSFDKGNSLVPSVAGPSWDHLEDELEALVCRNADQPPYRTLREMLKLQWEAAAKDLDAVVGSTAQQPVYSRLLTSWLPTVPIARTTGHGTNQELENRFLAKPYDTKEEQLKEAAYVVFLKNYLEEHKEDLSPAEMAKKYEAIIEYITNKEQEFVDDYLLQHPEDSEGAKTFVQYLEAVASGGEIDGDTLKLPENFVLKQLPGIPEPNKFNLANGQFLLEEGLFLEPKENLNIILKQVNNNIGEYPDHLKGFVNAHAFKQWLYEHAGSLKELQMSDLFQKWSACVRLSYIPPLSSKQVQTEKYELLADNSSIEMSHASLADELIAADPWWIEKYKAFDVREQISAFAQFENQIGGQQLWKWFLTDFGTQAQGFVDANAVGSYYQYFLGTGKYTFEQKPITYRVFLTPLAVVQKDLKLDVSISQIMPLIEFDASTRNMLHEALQQDEAFKMLYKYCFPLERFVSLMAAYSSLSFGKLHNIADTFAATKQEIKKLFDTTTKGAGDLNYQNKECVNGAATQAGSVAGGGIALPCLGLGLGLLFGIPNLGLSSGACIDFPDIGFPKIIAKLALATPMLILKGVVRLTDPNVGLAMLLAEVCCLKKTNLPLPLASLLLLPCNVFPPPPLGPGIGPPITPLGFAYLAASVAGIDALGGSIKLGAKAKQGLPKSLVAGLAQPCPEKQLSSLESQQLGSQMAQTFKTDSLASLML